MSYSDSSDDVFTPYSEDKTYSKNIILEKQKKEQKYEENRRQKFEEIANKQDHIIFNLQGISLMKFKSTKIKFCYQPSLLYEHISKKNIFYCSLRYYIRYKKWLISREPMPARPLFYKVTSGNVLINDNLENIGEVIIKIYTKLRQWSENEIRYRRKKYEQYRDGKLSYLDIDSTDEELYFSEDEKQALFEKRQAVLRRMIPPKSSQYRLRPRRKLTTFQ